MRTISARSLIVRLSHAFLSAAAFTTATLALGQNLASTLYPLEPGDSWVYQKEWLYGNMAHPSIERWTTEETIVSSAAVPEAAASLVTRRIRVLDHSVPPGFIAGNDSTRKELPESHLLIHGNCVYILDGIDAQGGACAPGPDNSCVRPLDFANRLRPEYRDALLAGKIPADFCFPMAAHTAWGRTPFTSPAGEYVWHVTGLNPDPFGPTGDQTFHMSSHLGSGTSVDRWFTEGVGVVQEIILHHGTYDEWRRRLVRTKIGGTVQDYELTPARAVPLSEFDCEGEAWRHFTRSNGAPFRNAADCNASVSRPK
jgi:hypothetical protein